MHSEPRRTAATKPLTLAAATLAAALALTGCAASSATETRPSDDAGTVSTPSSDRASDAPVTPDGASPADPGASGANLVTLSMAGQSFTFVPTTCMIGDEDVLVDGPGKNDDSGDVAYLGIDLFTLDDRMQGEIRIDLGTDEAFTSSDDILLVKVGPDHESSLMFDENTIVAEGIVLEDGWSELGPGTFEITCA